MQSRIEQQVMGSVAVVYTARQLTSRVALECYAFVASLVALWQLTWVHRVLENWSHVGLGGSWSYGTYAVMHTHLPVQLALLVAAAAGVALMVDAIRTLSRPRQSLWLQR